VPSPWYFRSQDSGRILHAWHQEMVVGYLSCVGGVRRLCLPQWLWAIRNILYVEAGTGQLSDLRVCQMTSAVSLRVYQQVAFRHAGVWLGRTLLSAFMLGGVACGGSCLAVCRTLRGTVHELSSSVLTDLWWLLAWREAVQCLQDC
jgi:hypothetical protein